MKTFAAVLGVIALGFLGEAQNAHDPTGAADILKIYGAQRGIGIVLDDERVGVELARRSELTVYVFLSDEGRAAGARKAVESAGLSAQRVRIEKGPPETLEYPDWSANLILCPTLPSETSLKDLWRVLRPEGFLFVGGADSGEASLKAAGIGDFRLLERRGRWIPIRRDRLEGAAEWTHRDYDPTQNRYSPDRHIRPPFRPLWYTRPVHTRGSFWASQGLTAGGRIFIAGQSPSNPKRGYITALDAYNGVELWAREVGGDRYTRVRGVAEDSSMWVRIFQTPGCIQPREMAARADLLFVGDSGRCLVVDAATGKDVKEFKSPPPTDPKNCWRYVALVGDTLYGYTSGSDPLPQDRYDSNPRPPEGGPPTLFALEVETGKPRWVRAGGTAEKLGATFPPPLAIGDDRIFVQVGRDALHAIDAKTGKTVWTAEGLNQAKETWWEGVAHRGTFYLDRYNIRTYGSKNRLSTLVFSAADGQRLKEFQAEDKDLAFSVSEQLCRTPAGHGGNCQYLTAAGGVRFDRNFYWTADGNRQLYGGFRAACLVGTLPANGLVHVLPNSLECWCLPFIGTVTLQPGLSVERVPADFNPVIERPAAPAPEEPKAAAETDWPTVLGNVARTGRTAQDLSSPARLVWETRIAGSPTPPVAAGDLVFLGSTDEYVYALERATGKVRWKHPTSGPIHAAPTYWQGRVYAGSDDGWVNCLSASDGRPLWRYRGAPFGRKQVAYGSVVSAWPIRQGIAADAGTLYLTAGLLPGQGVSFYALDAQDGKMLWRTELRDVVPSGYLALNEERVFVPTDGLSYPVHLDRKTGKLLKSDGRTSFQQLSYVRGVQGVDDAAFEKGFLVFGSRTRARLSISGPDGSSYDVFAAPWDKAPRESSLRESLSSPLVTLSPPVFGDAGAYFRSAGRTVSAVDRGKFFRMTAKKGKGDTSELRWRVENLPCGDPDWLVLAEVPRAATLLVGGPEGVCALDAEKGGVRWSTAFQGPTLLPAVARGHVFTSSPDGAVRCVGPR